MRVFKLTNLVLDINAVFYSGKSRKITPDDVNRHIAEGTIFTFLIDRLPHSGSIEVLDPVDRLELLIEWDQLHQRRNLMGFERIRNGWCLLIAYLMEVIARRCER